MERKKRLTLLSGVRPEKRISFHLSSVKLDLSEANTLKWQWLLYQYQYFRKTNKNKNKNN